MHSKYSWVSIVALVGYVRVNTVNRHAILSPRYPQYRDRPATNTDMLLILGEIHQATFPGGKQWPDAGLPPTVVQGVKVWVNPIVRVPGRKSSKHRVMCECPGCGTVLSAGRLFQHVCKP